MSLIRWGTEGSQVYIYQDVTGPLRCCACDLGGGELPGFDAKTAAEMVEHVKLHRERGDIVPQRVFDSLIEDAAVWDAEIAEGIAEYAAAQKEPKP